MADTNQFDQAARYFIRTDPVAVLGWVLSCRPTDFRFLGWLDTRSVPFPGETDRVGDLVARVERAEPPGQPWLVALEVQIEPDPLMFGRLLEYVGRLWRAEKPSPERGDRFWLAAAVLNLTGVGRASQDFEWSPNGPRTCLRVAERNPAQESATTMLADVAAGKLSAALLPLIPLMQDGAESGIIEEWIRLASAEPNARRRSDHGSLAVIFAEAAGIQPLWKESLKDWNMTQSLQVLEWQAQAQAMSILGVLEDRFGSVPSDLIASLQSITDTKRLVKVTVIASKATSLDQFRTDAGL